MDNNRIKNLTVLAQTKYLSLYDAEYINKKGIKKHWTIASRKDFNTLKEKFFKGREQNIDAVIIAALHKESKSLVLIKQFRVPLNDYVYEIPAGLLDGNETIEQAVKRELKEETGLNLIKINNEKSKNKVYVSVGMTDESVAMVYCTCEGEISNKYLEDDEDIETILVSQEKAKELLKQNINMDIKAWMTLQVFASLGEDLFY
ncbi:ADP-ribose pyrophosphatase [Clostridium sp. USBA 49]|uniref:NUDIX hydrolase n=1 Tax=Clostridium sp. USBA 49 TaxID=1881060 RepID=UPI000999F054|nr:NUDIX hydrolase [Clostridium sp. USBA 49]SKA86317.1 ADP-ribose pyrophosphatase [Clostridium sp. USBA 49]